MSFTNGEITWTPQTASEHALAMLDNWNAQLQNLGLPQIIATQANAAWLFLLAVGSKLQERDEDLAAAINSFNLALADGAQISNLLPIAGTSLIPGAYSLVNMQVIAASGTCIVPSGAILPFGEVNFTTLSGISVPGSGIGYVEAICDTLGPVIVGPNQITAFGSSITNLFSVTNPESAIVGRYTETQNEARQRLIFGDTIGWNINGLQIALQAISGVNAVRVYFNYSTTDDLVLPGGAIVEPRHCKIMIAGEDISGTEIASTYASLMTAPTDGSETQQYTYQTGQTIDVNYDIAGSQDFYVKVYYDPDQPTQDGFENQILYSLSLMQFDIGQPIYSDTILQALGDFPYAAITGAEVSLDGMAWSRKISIDGTDIPNLPPANVTVASE